jgi:hypothetical protein
MFTEKEYVSDTHLEEYRGFMILKFFQKRR